MSMRVEMKNQPQRLITGERDDDDKVVVVVVVVDNDRENGR